jgi:hypothetical protein
VSVLDNGDHTMARLMENRRQCTDRGGWEYLGWINTTVTTCRPLVTSFVKPATLPCRVFNVRWGEDPFASCTRREKFFGTGGRPYNEVCACVFVDLGVVHLLRRGCGA